MPRSVVEVLDDPLEDLVLLSVRVSLVEEDFVDELGVLVIVEL
jgi:hypothetical protein